MASILREVVVDCQDPAGLARFWGDVLGWPVVEDERGFCWLGNEFCLLGRRVDQ